MFRDCVCQEFENMIRKKWAATKKHMTNEYETTW